MKTDSSSTSTVTSSSATILHGVRLWLARFIWLLLVGIVLLLFVRGIPLRADVMQNKYQATIGSDVNRDYLGELAMSPWGGYPASQAGILNGDVVISVDGGSPDPGFVNGPAGTPVTVNVQTGNHPVREYKLFYGGENPVALAQFGIPVDFMATYAAAIEIGFALIYLGIAGLIFVRRSDDWLALLASIAFVLTLSAEIFIAVNDAEPYWRTALSAWYSIIVYIVLLFLYFFPKGKNVPRWVLVLAFAATIWTVIYATTPAVRIWRMPKPYGFLILLGWLLTGLFTQFYHYRHANPLQKQQTKWVLLGTSAMLVGTVAEVASYNWQISAGSPTVLYDLVGYPVIQLFKLLL
jgi:hypothetical protein